MQPILRQTGQSAIQQLRLPLRQKVGTPAQGAFRPEGASGKAGEPLPFYRRWQALFRPAAKMRAVSELTPSNVRALGDFKGVLLDLDDTVAPMFRGQVGPDMLHNLKTLQKDGYQLGIVSNNFHRKYCQKIHQTLQNAGLNVHFLGNARKPGTQGYQTMLERMGLKAKEVLMVGDSQLGDVWGANRMGMTTIRAKWYTAKGFQNWKICRWARELMDWMWTGLRCLFTNARKPVWVSEKSGKTA